MVDIHNACMAISVRLRNISHVGIVKHDVPISTECFGMTCFLHSMDYIDVFYEGLSHHELQTVSVVYHY